MGLLAALSTPAVIALVAGAIVALAFVGALVALALRRRGAARRPDIPTGMRPGPPDEVLERRHLERIMGWGVLLVLFFALWLPVVWLREPDQNVVDEVELVNRSIERGNRWFEVASDENPVGFGCAQCHGAEAQGGTVPFTTEDGQFIPDYPAPSLVDVCGRLSLEDIRATIEQGREGTPMPSWSVRFAGPMNDQQIDDLINYLVSIQEVPEKDNLCTGAGAAMGGEEPEPGPEGSPDAEESP